MAELFDVINAFSLPLKVAWVVWLVWGVGQIYWYRHEEAKRPAVAKMVRALPRGPRKPVSAGPAVTTLLTGDSVSPRPVRAMPEASTFDPATAVVETFGGEATDLDAIVADFERHNGHRRAVPPEGDSARP
jgi:hypothetical protein